MLKKRQIVEVFLFRRSESEMLEYLLLRRTNDRGGFWQPVTGKVEGMETLEQAAVREVREETGITLVDQIIPTGYSFNFSDSRGINTEFVFGGRIDLGIEAKLSHEHDSKIWANRERAIEMLRWPENREGLNKLHEILVKKPTRSREVRKA